MFGFVIGINQNKPQALGPIFQDRMIKFRKRNIIYDGIYTSIVLPILYLLNNYLVNITSIFGVIIPVIMLLLITMFFFKFILYIQDYNSYIYQDRIVFSVDWIWKRRVIIEIKDLKQVVSYPNYLNFIMISGLCFRLDLKDLDDPSIFINHLKNILVKNNVDYDVRK